MPLLDWLIRRSDFLSDAQADLAHLRLIAIPGITARLIGMEKLIMTSAQDLVARLDAATNEIAADLRAARDAALAAAADKDEAVRVAVAEALAPLDAGITRLEVLGQDPADPVPAPAEPAPADDPAPAEPEAPADPAPADPAPADPSDETPPAA